MKRNVLAYLVLLVFTFVGCDGDSDDDVPAPVIPDTIAPEVTIVVPEENDSLLLIDVIQVYATLTDNRRLDNVRVILNEPGGGSQVLNDGPIKVADDYGNYNLMVIHQIPRNAATGEYSVMVEVNDFGKNVAQDSVRFSVYASDVSKTTFQRPFSNGLLNRFFTETLEWYGYNYWDSGYLFEDVWFGVLMYLIVTTDNDNNVSKSEWNRFVSDFRIKGQNWATWDENNDGSLDDAEFYAGMAKLNLFKEWDENQDKYLSFDEMAAGFFTRWDHNQDGVLSVEEYMEKFYTYLGRI